MIRAQHDEGRQGGTAFQPKVAVSIPLILGSLAAPCHLSAEEIRHTTLSDTTWHLYAIHSMDDRQGTTHITEPARFTLHFGGDGRASFRLDCNRGTSTWTSEATEAQSGPLRFGVLAGTRALCPHPRLDERIVRDLAHARSYRLEKGRLYISLAADGGIYEWQPPSPTSQTTDDTPTKYDRERTIKTVHFGKGAMSSMIKGQIEGYHYIDYQLQAGAGQHLKASFQSRNGSSYFNVLPPDSDHAAMFVGSTTGNRFDRILPDDGRYILRVYQMRAGARRNEKSNFTLSVALEGQRLSPLSATEDAKIPGTRFHAQARITCAPAYSTERECEASVIRRSHDGTATVEIRWQQNGLRRILFVRGVAASADTFQPMRVARSNHGWIVSFDGRERFEIPIPLVYGG